MIAAVRIWYLGRTPRERTLLLVMALIALPLLAWLLVVRPLDRADETALQEQLEAVDRNGRVRALAQLVEQQPQGQAAQALGPDLVLVVAESAARAGVTLDSNEAGGLDEVSIGAASASPRTLISWLHGLEASGLVVADLRIVPADVETVSVTARLKRIA